MIRDVKVLLGFSSVETMVLDTSLADGKEVAVEEDIRGRNTPSSYALSNTL